MAPYWGTLTHDILKEIFVFCQDRDLPNHARTCKNWRDPALDPLWFELRAKDFIHAFAILAPLAPLAFQDNPHFIQMDFTRRISHYDWERFRPYSLRVKKINGSYSTCLEVLSKSALAAIFMSKPWTTPIFPRCRSLFFDESLNYPCQYWGQVLSALFHEGIQEIRIRIHEPSPDYVLNFFEEAVHRAPHATSLSLETSGAAGLHDKLGASLIPLISTMHKLTNVVACSRLLTAQVLSALEQLPNLQGVEMYQISRRGGRASGFLPEAASPHPFPQLTVFMPQCSLYELCRYLSTAIGMAPNLVQLDIDVISEANPSNIQDTLDKIAESFPMLQFLSMFRKEDFSVFEGEFGGTVGIPLTYRNIIPITRIHRLRMFAIHYDGIISMDNSELCALLAQCLSLIHLEFNHEPKILPLSPTARGLSIDVLPMIAQVRPQLEVLSLYLDSAVDTLPPQTPQPFRRLEVIRFGISPVQNKQVIAAWLAQVIPEGCQLLSNALFEPGVEALFVPDDEELEIREWRRKEWAEVADWIPILREVRRKAILEATEQTDSVEN